MNHSDIDLIAEKLVAARQTNRLDHTLDTDAIGVAPTALEDAYRIQQAVVDATGAVGGWKTGASTAQSVPIAAPVFADCVYPNNVTLKRERMRLIGLEAELAFRMAHDLPASATPYQQDEVEAAVDCMLPLIELVDSRLRDFAAAGDLWKLADNQINSGLVLGRPIHDWRQLDLARQRVVLRADQQLIADATGWNYDGTPIGLLVRFVNTFADHCGGIRAGQVVTLGSMTGIDFIESAATVSADFGESGVVRLSFE